MKVHNASGGRQANTRTWEVLGPMQPNERLGKPLLDVRGAQSVPTDYRRTRSYMWGPGPKA